jgi:hypothetical protein
MYVLVKTPTSAAEKSESYTFNDVYDLLIHVSAMVKAESQKKTLPPVQQLPLPLEEATQSDEEQEDNDTEEEEQESSILENVHEPLFTGVIDRKKNDEEIMERIQQIQSHGSEKHYHTHSLNKVLDYFIKTFLTTTELDSNDMTLFIEKQLLINYCYGLFVTFPERFIKNSHEFQNMKGLIDRVEDLFTPALHVLLERRKPLPNSKPGYRAAYVLADDSFLPLEAMVGTLMAVRSDHNVLNYKDALEVCSTTLKDTVFLTNVTPLALDDWVDLFVKEKVTKHETGILQSSLVYTEFETWLGACAPRELSVILSTQHFSKVMKENHGFETIRKAAGMFYKQVCWKPKTIQEPQQVLSAWNSQSPFENRWATV